PASAPGRRPRCAGSRSATRTPSRSATTTSRTSCRGRSRVSRAAPTNGCSSSWSHTEVSADGSRSSWRRRGSRRRRSGRRWSAEASGEPPAYHPGMDRSTAHAFAHEKCEKETTYRHLISVEGVMRSLVRHFGEDQELWGLTGLFHDLDQDQTGDDGSQHAILAA